MMSKAKFPNTTRRRLSSSVVCRLSSSGAAFFFPRFFFFHDPSLHSDKRPPKQGPYSCCSRPMIGLMGPVAGGASRPVARAADEDAGPVDDDNAEGPVARGGDGTSASACSLSPVAERNSQREEAKPGSTVSCKR